MKGIDAKERTWRNLKKFLPLVVGIFLYSFCGMAQEMEPQTGTLPVSPARKAVIETTEGTCMNVDISPDGNTLVFDLLGNIFTIPVEGGEAIQITEGISWDSRPVWSPDGKHIAFISDLTGAENIWIMDSGGNNKKPVSREKEKGFNTGVEWGPGGSFLLGNGYRYDLEGEKKALPSTVRGSEIRFSPGGRYLYANGAGLVRYNRATGDTVSMAPSGKRYGRAAVSPDGQWMAYVTLNDFMYRGESCNRLRLRNLHTGEERVLTDSLGQWRISWERFVFTPGSEAVIIGYGGKLHRVDINTGKDTVIPFSVRAHMELGPLVYHTNTLPRDSLDIRYIRNADISPDKEEAVFSALSEVYRISLPGGKPRLLAPGVAGCFQPVYSPDGRKMAFISAEDGEEGHVWSMPSKGGKPQQLTAYKGKYRNPAWSVDGNTLAFTEGSTGRNGYGRSLGKLWVLSGESDMAEIIADSIPLPNSLSFTRSGEIAYLGTGTGASRPFYLQEPDSNKKKVLTELPYYATEAVLSPCGRYIAYTWHEDIYLARLSPRGTPRASAGTTATPGEMPGIRLTTFRGGRQPRWKQDGEIITWLSGNTILGIPRRKALSVCENNHPGKIKDSIQPDTLAVFRYKRPLYRSGDVLVLSGADVIPMNGKELIKNAVIVIENGRIAEVGIPGEVDIPQNAKIIDVQGKTILPGFIDMHAHDSPPSDLLSGDWREFKKELALGVTTVRNPSTGVETYGLAELSEIGGITAPRIFGAVGIVNNKFRINTLEDARRLARTYKSMGAVFLKVHDSWPRKQRQLLVMAAKEEELNITAHADTDNYLGIFNLSVILDGFTGWEHILPVGKLYDDVKQLLAISGTWYTPTLLAMTGRLGAFRESYGLDNSRVMQPGISRNKGKQREETELIPEHSRLMYYAENAAQMSLSGARVTAGSHGDVPGMELHWELQALLAGGMTGHEALQTITLLAAEGLGMQNDLGSIEPGKIADILVLDKNPLEDIRKTLSVRYVIKNGIVYDSKTLHVIWP
ncbi:hypothetical protein ED312_22980 [Sinomicrobium pectinilyticum]|uniref:Amidohydrolase-related domain-containing protein n=1 Tax=Sinomicrobium pectinilyticum TaxID=1084421 RepID=A0A3N0CZK8_SINP1|nr:amidohydrolase family protein [Sinomicrobium pectinilyticum]RNL68636.1 hypothetical protein ED312_22980 [Sinomicrobium pectinilyticum]